MSLKKVVREPLLHFFLVGAAFFLVYGWVNREETIDANEIVVSAGQVDRLVMQFERLWTRKPTEEELKGLVDNWVRQEILYREGLALGLDRDDPVLKRRVAQKMTFITEGLGEAEPTEAELQAWLDERPAQYAIEPRYTFHQVFFDPERHEGSMEDVVSGALQAIDEGAVAGELGDPSLLPARMDNAPASRVQATFGEPFASGLAGLEPGRWASTVTSAYGPHLVYLEQATPARAATLDDVRAEVARDLAAARREAADEAFYEALRARYTVRYPEAPEDAEAAAGAGANG